MPRKVKTTMTVLGSDGSSREVPRTDVWTLPNISYGYVINRDLKGIAWSRWNNRWKTTGLKFTPANRKEACRRTEAWIRGFTRPAGGEPLGPMTVARAFAIYKKQKLGGDTVRERRRREQAERTRKIFFAGRPDYTISNQSVARLTGDGIVRMRDGTAEQPALSAKSIKDYAAPWFAFCRWCRALDYISIDPRVLVRLPEIQKSRTARAYSDDELERINDWFGRSGLAPWYPELWTFLAWTGMRIHEALALTWECVHPDRIELVVTKGDRPRVFPLGVFAELAGVLERLRANTAAESAGDQRLFPRSPDRTMSHLKRCLAELKIDAGPRPQHVFRATAIRRWRLERIDIETRARLAGHSPAVAISHYDAETSAVELADAIMIARTRVRRYDSAMNTTGAGDGE